MADSDDQPRRIIKIKRINPRSETQDCSDSTMTLPTLEESTLELVGSIEDEERQVEDLVMPASGDDTDSESQQQAEAAHQSVEAMGPHESEQLGETETAGGLSADLNCDLHASEYSSLPDPKQVPGTEAIDGRDPSKRSIETRQEVRNQDSSTLATRPVAMTLGDVTPGSPAIDQRVEGLVNDFWGFNVKWIENAVQEWSENAADRRKMELEESRKVLGSKISSSLENIRLDLYAAAMIEFRDVKQMSDIHCETAGKKDTQKLRSILNVNLAKRCSEMPQLFERLAGEYPSSKEALVQARSISDKAFFELANKEISHIQGEFEEGVERVTQAEEREVNKILERKLQEVQVAQKVERVKQQAIKESDAQFVKKLARTESMKAEEKRTRKVRRTSSSVASGSHDAVQQAHRRQKVSLEQRPQLLRPSQVSQPQPATLLPSQVSQPQPAALLPSQASQPPPPPPQQQQQQQQQPLPPPPQQLLPPPQVSQPQPATPPQQLLPPPQMAQPPPPQHQQHLQPPPQVSQPLPPPPQQQQLLQPPPQQQLPPPQVSQLQPTTLHQQLLPLPQIAQPPPPQQQQPLRPPPQQQLPPSQASQPLPPPPQQLLPPPQVSQSLPQISQGPHLQQQQDSIRANEQFALSHKILASVGKSLQRFNRENSIEGGQQHAEHIRGQEAEPQAMEVDRTDGQRHVETTEGQETDLQLMEVDRSDGQQCGGTTEGQEIEPQATNENQHETQVASQVRDLGRQMASESQDTEMGQNKTSAQMRNLELNPNPFPARTETADKVINDEPSSRQEPPPPMPEQQAPTPQQSLPPPPPQQVPQLPPQKVLPHIPQSPLPPQRPLPQPQQQFEPPPQQLPLPAPRPPPPQPLQQNPSGAADSHFGASRLSQTSLSGMGLPEDVLARFCDVLDRNTKALDFMNNRMIHSELRATASPMPSSTVQASESVVRASTVQDADDELSDNDIAPKTKWQNGFRGRARSTSHKSIDERKYRGNVRGHANKLMGRTRKDKVEPASEETVLKYKHTGKDEDGPSMDLFRVDFSESCAAKSPWNTRLAAIFANDYTKCGLPFRELKDVSDYFLKYLQSLQTVHRKAATPATSGKGTAKDEASRRDRVSKRKRSRFESQLSALEYFGLDRFTKCLSDMSHAVLSDDESDHENGTNLGRSHYVIVKEEWRSDELIKWLRMIDLLACGEKWDGRNVARQGNIRHLRVVSTRSKDGVAVWGLPKNCYNPGWLKKLKPYQRKHLGPTAVIDMTFTEEERALAVQYIPLTKGKDQFSTSPDTSPDISHLDNWLLYEYGRVQDE